MSVRDWAGQPSQPETTGRRQLASWRSRHRENEALRRFNMVHARDPLWHIETPLGIVNITVGLRDADGNPVDSIEVIADQGVERDGYANTRLIRRPAMPTFENWAAIETNEGVFYAASKTEQVGPYASRDEARERARFENENECGAYYSAKRVGSLHEETPRSGTSYCNTCGDVSDLDPDSEAARQWHGDHFFDNED